MSRRIKPQKIIFVHRPVSTYTQPLVIAKRNLVRWTAGAALLVCAAGCGGVSATKSISPLDFILPGLIQNHSTPPAPAGTDTNSVARLAQVSK